jgi:hypothetical protein
MPPRWRICSHRRSRTDGRGMWHRSSPPPLLLFHLGRGTNDGYPPRPPSSWIHDRSSSSSYTTWETYSHRRWHIIRRAAIDYRTRESRSIPRMHLGSLVRWYVRLYPSACVTQRSKIFYSFIAEQHAQNKRAAVSAKSQSIYHGYPDGARNTS